MLVAFVSAPIGGTKEVWTQRSSDGGGSFGVPVQVTLAAQSGQVPAAAHADLRGSNAIVAWLEDGPDQQSNIVRTVMASASTNAGSSWTTFGTVLVGAPGLQRLALTTAVSATGNRTVAWQAMSAGQAPEVRSALSLDGGQSWPTIVSRSGTTGASISPVVVGGAGTIFVHLWADAPVGGAATVLLGY